MMDENTAEGMLFPVLPILDKCYNATKEGRPFDSCRGGLYGSTCQI